MKKLQFGVMLVLALLAVLPAAALDRPNVIIVFADDISARELPLYGASMWSPPERGSTDDPSVRAYTPAIDQMAEEGCWVTTCWAATVCSPSRAMMMTGRYAHRHKWWTNREIGQVQRANGKRETWPLYESSPLQIGHLAQQAGYGTFWTGKTQMPGDLRRYGFDEGCFTPGNLSDRDNPYTDFKLEFVGKGPDKKMINKDTGELVDTYLQHGWYWYPHVLLMNHPTNQGEPFMWWPNTPESKASYGLTTYGPDVELDFAFEFMDRKHAEGKPFFIYHTSHLGHDGFDWLDPDSEGDWPGTPKIQWNGEGYTRTEPRVTGDRGVYDTHGTVTSTGMHHHVNYLDYQMWRYRQKLEEMGIADNTVVIFLADNGSALYGKHSPDRQKGTHVPLVIYAPGMSKQGEQDILVNLSDFLPTLADAMGQQIPEDYPVDGESFWPYLMTDKAEHRPWVYAHKGRMQLVRGEQVMLDGFGRWWDVTAEPDDLISFPQIKDWSSVSEGLRAERDALETAIEPFDLYDEAYDAPGTPPKPKKSKTKKKGGKKKKAS